MICIPMLNELVFRQYARNALYASAAVSAQGVFWASVMYS